MKRHLAVFLAFVMLAVNINFGVFGSPSPVCNESGDTTLVMLSTEKDTELVDESETLSFDEEEPEDDINVDTTEIEKDVELTDESETLSFDEEELQSDIIVDANEIEKEEPEGDVSTETDEKVIVSYELNDESSEDNQESDIEEIEEEVNFEAKIEQESGSDDIVVEKVEQEIRDKIATDSEVEADNEQEDADAKLLVSEISDSVFGESTNDYYTFGPRWKEVLDSTEMDSACIIYFIDYDKTPQDYVNYEGDYNIQERDLPYEGLKLYIDDKASPHIFIKPSENKQIKLESSCAGLFKDFTGVTRIENIVKLDTSNVTNMEEMFANMHSIEALVLTAFDTSKVVNMKSMFKNNNSNGLYLPFDTKNVTDMSSMFEGCSNLEHILIESGFVVDYPNINTTDMFKDCFSLMNYDENHIDGYYAHNINDYGEDGYFIIPDSAGPADSNGRRIERIEVGGEFVKKEYNVGEKFDLTGIIIDAYFDDGTSNSYEYSRETKYMFKVVSNCDEVLIDTEYKKYSFAGFPFDINFADNGITILPASPEVIEEIVVYRSPNNKYLTGDKFNPNGLALRIYYTFTSVCSFIYYGDSTKNNFSFEPSLDTALSYKNRSVKIDYLNLGKQAEFALDVATLMIDDNGNTSRYYGDPAYMHYHGGRGSSSSSSSGGGGRITGPISNSPQDRSLAQAIAEKDVKLTTLNSSSTMPLAVFLGGTEQWVLDKNTGSYQLMGVDNSGNAAPLSNGFARIANGVSAVTNLTTFDTYYFDEGGKMVTGWMQTTDGKTFFFENAKGINEGKMSIGWKQVGGSWYYFSQDGSMLSNAVTPDGYLVGSTGVWQS